MNERLIVKPFLCLEDIDIEVKDFLVLIGPQAVGKSLCAKLLDLFNKHLNEPVIVYDTTNQCHSQSMPIVAMSPVWICHALERFYCGIGRFNHNTSPCKLFIIGFFIFGQLMVFT
jgi:energy-coupling factor transporter ATP-binding protein EcfA2